MILSLAYRPFLDPLDLHGVWYALLLPMAFGIALAYRAVRQTDMDHYFKSVLSLTGQIFVGISAVGAASYVVIQVLVPILVPMAE